MKHEKPESVETEYEKPKIVDYGDLIDLTAGRHEGNWLDASFPINTPKRKLTFYS